MEDGRWMLAEKIYVLSWRKKILQIALIYTEFVTSNLKP